jgi:lipopolysaccharide export LptBFGC system permease protein LptF
MTEATSLTRFKSELNSFFALILANLVFGAMAMAFGLQFIVGSVLGQIGFSPASSLLSVSGLAWHGYSPAHGY